LQVHKVNERESKNKSVTGLGGEVQGGVALVVRVVEVHGWELGQGLEHCQGAAGGHITHRCLKTNAVFINWRPKINNIS